MILNIQSRIKDEPSVRAEEILVDFYKAFLDRNVIVYEYDEKFKDFKIEDSEKSKILLSEQGVHRIILEHGVGRRSHCFVTVVINGDFKNQNTIRDYVLCPYVRFFDIRTGKETDNMDFLKNGNLEMVASNV